jgi:hypothetical protein
MPDPTGAGGSRLRRPRGLRRLWHEPPSAAWALGLVLTTAIIYGSAAAYQRWADDEARLDALEYRGSYLTLYQELVKGPAATVPATTAAPAAPDTASPARKTGLENPTGYAPGTWERAAQQFILGDYARTVSSANPPRSRKP